MLRVTYQKYGTSLLVLVFLVIGLYIVSPYLMSVAFAAVLAVLVNPIYKFALKILKYRALASLFTSITTVLAILLPIFAVINSVVIEAGKLYKLISTNLYAADQTAISTFFTSIETTLAAAGINAQALISQVLTGILSISQSFLVSLPSSSTKLFVVVFTLFFFLKEQEKVLAFINEYVPLKPKLKEEFIKKSTSVTTGVLYGTLITAALQAVVATIGYIFFGISAPLILGILTLFFALVPFLGTAVVTVPLGILMLFLDHSGSTSWWLAESLGGNVWWLRGAGILAYGALVVGLVDNIVKPKLVGDRSELHPALALLGILGGIQTLGPTGIIIGPIILAIIIQFFMVAKKSNTNK